MEVEMMKHWEGKKVVITRDDEYHSRLYGTIQHWDIEKNRLVLQPGSIHILLNDILHIKELKMLPQDLNSAAWELNSVGYLMKQPVQFDNAILFSSKVMIWKDDQLIEPFARLVRHNRERVILDDHRTFTKADHQFVVRSRRGC
ncbi:MULTISPECIES: hypothetical protein [Paenibacillus]|uniref:hypothetical protein n=1 Tax=Paenibacillus TaxID=44249 RepID=UPI00037B51DD|nr:MULTISPECIES: hypothetical protein [Paenibacillus]